MRPCRIADYLRANSNVGQLKYWCPNRSPMASLLFSSLSTSLQLVYWNMAASIVMLLVPGSAIGMPSINNFLLMRLSPVRL